jgi:CRP-like cAMP-binding protein
LLAALQQTEWQRSRPPLEHVNLELGQVLCEPGLRQSHVYFPTSGIVSLVHSVDSGAAAEIAVVGNDGFVGAGLLLGGGSTTSRGEVQVAGEGFRIGARAVEDAFERSATVRRLLLRSMQALMTQIAQIAVCNRHHTLEQRLCRLLLMRLDRLQDNELVTTQERIADLLGTRREGVNEAALRMQAAGLIRCTRSHIAILDGARLAQRSCECYAVVRKECDRLIGAPSNGVALCSSRTRNVGRDEAGRAAHYTARTQPPSARVYDARGRVDAGAARHASMLARSPPTQ